MIEDTRERTRKSADVKNAESLSIYLQKVNVSLFVVVLLVSLVPEQDSNWLVEVLRTKRVDNAVVPGPEGC